MAGTDGRDPSDDYKNLLKELKLYDPAILKKPSYVIANKMDQESSAEFLKKFKRKHKAAILLISADKGEGLDDLRRLLHKKLIRG
jgi:GTP-binding protein